MEAEEILPQFLILERVNSMKWYLTGHVITVTCASFTLASSKVNGANILVTKAPHYSMMIMIHFRRNLTAQQSFRKLYWTQAWPPRQNRVHYLPSPKAKAQTQTCAAFLNKHCASVQIMKASQTNWPCHETTWQALLPLTKHTLAEHGS